MPYVRDRIAPASKDYARKRRTANRQRLAPGSGSADGRLGGAYDWFRAAAVYAGRRSYRTRVIADAAMVRRGRIVAEAARVLQECGTEICALVPASFRPSARLGEFRGAYGKAATPQEALYAANAWLLFALRRAERYARVDGTVQARAAAICDRVTARLIEWAEEMDADDYPE